MWELYAMVGEAQRVWSLQGPRNDIGEEITDSGHALANSYIWRQTLW